jgi:hypothetical protein
MSQSGQSDAASGTSWRASSSSMISGERSRQAGATSTSLPRAVDGRGGLSMLWRVYEEACYCYLGVLDEMSR